MVILNFHEDIKHIITSHKITKSQYLSFMTYNPKNRRIYFLQHWKLEEQKCTYFHDQRSSWWVMVILCFHEDIKHLIICPKITKKSYLSLMTYNPKNRGTLFSSTLKVGQTKVHLFSWSEVILVSDGQFVFSLWH